MMTTRAKKASHANSASSPPSSATNMLHSSRPAEMSLFFYLWIQLIEKYLIFQMFCLGITLWQGPIEVHFSAKQGPQCTIAQQGSHNLNYTKMQFRGSTKVSTAKRFQHQYSSEERRDLEYQGARQVCRQIHLRHSGLDCAAERAGLHITQCNRAALCALCANCSLIHW